MSYGERVRAAKSGLSRETQAKILAKYDPKVAAQCLQWIRDIVNSSDDNTGQELNFDTDGSIENFTSVLRDGLVLARLSNSLAPGSVPKNRLQKAPTLAFKQMELIELFLRTVKLFGLADHEIFQTCDLYEKQNLHQVTTCIQALGRKAKGKGLVGFGPRESQLNVREFTEEQLRAGSAVIGLQMGTNKGANQSGVNFGKSRSILD